jgi:methylmalonyl-CoA mutase N-terminal domain/subunit
VTDLTDPLGGSYYLESVTRQLEDEALAYFQRIDDMGGMVAAIERGYPQREIAESAYRDQQAIETREQVIVGVNDFVESGGDAVGTLYIDEAAGERQLARLDALRATRNADGVQRTLAALQDGARSGANTMPLLLDAARAYATVGEMCDSLRAVWGEYVETPSI